MSPSKQGGDYSILNPPSPDRVFFEAQYRRRGPAPLNRMPNA